jgi:hypothetical protein
VYTRQDKNFSFETCKASFIVSTGPKAALRENALSVSKLNLPVDPNYHRDSVLRDFTNIPLFGLVDILTI